MHEGLELAPRSQETPVQFVSIIVPVYKDTSRLPLCLQALQDQTYSAKDYEVIVVDNGSNENLETIVEQFDQARIVAESRPTVYAARNQGLAQVQGDLIAFTDSDCIPDADWIANGVTALGQVPGPGIVGGPVDKFPRDELSMSAAELFDCIASYHQRHFIEDHHFCATCNLFTSRKTFDRVGLFDDRLRSGGDREWGLRVHRAGYPLLYSDNVRVRHPALFSLSELYRRYLRYSTGTCQVLYGNRQPLPSFLKDLLIATVPPVRRFMSHWSHPELRPVSRKLKLFFTMYFVKWAWLAGRISLKLGNPPPRT